MPNINPNFLEHPIIIKWYGVMYALAFIQFYILGNLKIKKDKNSIINKNELDSILLIGMLGVVIGGRLGEVFFYHPVNYLSNPISILMIKNGGMSYHGGLIGVLFLIIIWCIKNKKNIFKIFDFIVPLVPLGYMFGRIGNFINQELLGKETDFILGIYYPLQNKILHPVTLYHAIEGLITFIIIFTLSKKEQKTGFLTAYYLILSSSLRFFNEFFRQGDFYVDFKIFEISSGQIYSIPLIILGFILLKKMTK